MTISIPAQFNDYDLKEKLPMPFDWTENSNLRQRVLFDEIRATYPPELIQSISFLAAHFQEDILHSQYGPYGYSDQERRACDAVASWAVDLCRRMGVEPNALGSDTPTYHLADQLCDETGCAREEWPDC